MHLIATTTFCCFPYSQLIEFKNIRRTSWKRNIKSKLKENSELALRIQFHAFKNLMKHIDHFTRRYSKKLYSGVVSNVHLALLLAKEQLEDLLKLPLIQNGDRDTTRQKETMVRLDKAFFDAVNLHDEQIRSGDRRNRDWNKALSVVAGRYVSLAFLTSYLFFICILLDGGSVNSNTVALWRSCKHVTTR